MKRLRPIVLIVDDDPEFRKTLELVLGRFGLHVVGSSNTEDFLKNIEKVKPDLYLIDLQLGAQNGFDLIEALRKARGVVEPILVVSGARKPEMVTRALELGANDYIMKPLDRTFLASKLARYLDVETLREHRPKYLEVPRGRSAARLEFEGVVTEVDELGVQLRTKNLIPKGSVFKVKCDFLVEAGVADGETLVSIATTEFDSETKLYSMYAEFDGVDVEFMQAIRRWLTR